MLHITGSMKALKEEISQAKYLIQDIGNVLKKANAETNLTKDIGTFVVRMPDFKVLSKDAESAKQILRKVCSGELTPQDAYQKFVDAYNEIDKIFQLLNNFQ